MFTASITYSLMARISNTLQRIICLVYSSILNFSLHAHRYGWFSVEIVVVSKYVVVVVGSGLIG